jgi:hypothetical protein
LVFGLISRDRLLTLPKVLRSFVPSEKHMASTASSHVGELAEAMEGVMQATVDPCGRTSG